MGGGASSRQRDLLLPPISINAPRARPRYCPPLAPYPISCGPRIVQCPPQVRVLPPLPPRIIQLPPRFVPVSTCPPQPYCLPQSALRCLPNPCLPNPCQPACLPGPQLRYLPNSAQPACLPYQPRAYLPGAPPGSQYLAHPGGAYLQPRPYLPGHPEQFAPGVAARPISNLPSRQIEYVPTPVKQIDYTPPSLSRRHIPYNNGKVSRRSDYDDFDDVVGVRPDTAAANLDADDTALLDDPSKGKFVFHTPGLDSTADQVSPALAGTRLEYAPEGNRAQSSDGVALTQQSAGAISASGPYRVVNDGTGQALTGQSNGPYRLINDGSGQALTGQSNGQYRLINDGTGQALTGQSNATGGPTSSQAGIQYRLVSSQPDGADQASSDGLITAGDGQQYRIIQSSNAPTPYRVLNGQPESIAQQALDASTASNQYRLIQNATAPSSAEARVDQGNADQEFVEAVSEDGVHYHPVLPQPILTNVKLAQKSDRTISSLQYLLNNYNNNNNNNNNNSINSLFNNNNNNSINTYSITRSAGTLSQQQLVQDAFQGQDTIEIPVQVPVKVRIPAPNSANKQQTYNTTIECRQKPYCPDRDEQANN